jgi:ligand-binding SRPBCC domain-containing protein
MRLYTLECRMTAPVALQEAFEVFENPENLALITPPWLNLRISPESPVQMKKGAVITYRLRWMGIPLSWKTVITEYEPPFLFVDEQAEGPYRLWRHRHTFRPGVEGTEVSDQVDYALPFGWLGRIVHWLIVRNQLERIFTFRQKTLARLWSEVTARVVK